MTCSKQPRYIARKYPDGTTTYCDTVDDRFLDPIVDAALIASLSPDECLPSLPFPILMCTPEAEPNPFAVLCDNATLNTARGTIGSNAYRTHWEDDGTGLGTPILPALAASTPLANGVYQGVLAVDPGASDNTIFGLVETETFAQAPDTIQLNTASSSTAGSHAHRFSRLNNQPIQDGDFVEYRFLEWRLEPSAPECFIQPWNFFIQTSAQSDQSWRILVDGDGTNTSSIVGVSGGHTIVDEGGGSFLIDHTGSTANSNVRVAIDGIPPRSIRIQAVGSGGEQISNVNLTARFREYCCDPADVQNPALPAGSWKLTDTCTGLYQLVGDPATTATFDEILASDGIDCSNALLEELLECCNKHVQEHYLCIGGVKTPVLVSVDKATLSPTKVVHGLTFAEIPAADYAGGFVDPCSSCVVVPNRQCNSYSSYFAGYGQWLSDADYDSQATANVCPTGAPRNLWMRVRVFDGPASQVSDTVIGPYPVDSSGAQYLQALADISALTQSLGVTLIQRTSVVNGTPFNGFALQYNDGVSFGLTFEQGSDDGSGGVCWHDPNIGGAAWAMKFEAGVDTEAVESINPSGNLQDAFDNGSWTYQFSLPLEDCVSI